MKTQKAKRTRLEIAADRFRTGRPTVEAKGRLATVRFTDREYKRILAAARKSGKTVSDIIRKPFQGEK